MLGTARISLIPGKACGGTPRLQSIGCTSRYCLLYLPNFNVALKSELSEWLGFAGDGSYVNIHQFLEAELVQIALRGSLSKTGGVSDKQKQADAHAAHGLCGFCGKSIPEL